MTPTVQHPAPNPGRLSATTSLARAFREGEGYDFVLFIANHRLPSRREGWQSNRTAPFTRGRFSKPGCCRPHLSQDKQHLMRASTRHSRRLCTLGGFACGSARSCALPDPALLNKEKSSKSQGVFAHNRDLPVIFRLRVICADIITSCLPGRKCPTTAACMPPCLPAPSSGNACPATPKLAAFSPHSQSRESNN